LSRVILDASALLAYLKDEPGALVVEQALDQGVYISTVNWAEVLSKVADVGDPKVLIQEFSDRGWLNDQIRVEPLLMEDALMIAELRSVTRSSGLSLGDRACLALGKRLGLPVLTADRAWATVDVGVVIQVIR
jgi:ribonuclease VapC